MPEKPTYEELEQRVQELEKVESERQRAVEELRESEAYIKAVMDNLPIGVAVNSVDPNVTFSYMNDNFPRFYRTTREALSREDGFWNSVYEEPGFREKIKKRILEDCASGDPERMHWEEVPITRQGRETAFISAQNTPVPGKKLMISTVWDVSKRKRAEEELRESEERLQLVMEGSQLGYWDWDIQTGVVKRNRYWAEMLGYTLKEIEYTVKQWTDLHHPDDCAAAWKSIQDHLDGKTSVHRIEYRMRAKNGQYKWILDQARIVKNDDEGKPVRMTGTHTDITERKREEKEREKLQAQLAQAQKMESIGRLAGGVAHDFNNMLSVILGHTEMALEYVGPEQPIHADLQEIQKAAQHSADITRQLLAFARKQAVAPVVLDLNDTVEGMLRMLRRIIGEDIDLSWQPGKELPRVRIDPSQIDQILANLCVNARDAIAGTGRLTIETGSAAFDKDYCAQHRGFTPGNYVLLTVSDNGCGMDKQTLDHLFEPFFTTKGVDKGTGLGLATVYGIVRQNNGFINVYSEPGCGTAFKVYLPRHQTKAEVLPDEVRDHPAGKGHETILLVEDEPAILRMTKMMLERLGYQVIPAKTPGEAIRLAQEFAGKIHLLLTDVIMPEMNGRDLAGSLLSLYPDIKRLFMSGYTANVIAHHGVLDKGVNFIQKPFSRKALAVKVRESLDRTKEKSNL
ncbi:hybrid sensor histidine kinase/response regulator [Desulfospira joergensenii]|uniref:hybrid sensor histidine kinase/response regulator n=1 Tax=Desulfospira joergensenii TaxID=53329 RepID=UPI0003B32554|nr:PAS domain-containing sensor histidine kinase [Desulfospira joergensenii]